MRRGQSLTRCGRFPVRTDEALEGLSELEVFDKERLKMLIEKVVVYGADAVEIVWKVGNPFRGENSA